LENIRVYVALAEEFKTERGLRRRTLIVMSEKPPYIFQCRCYNLLGIVDAEFKCLDAGGMVEFAVSVPPTLLPGYLELEQATGNTVLVENFKFPDRHEHDGCYLVNDGDSIAITGLEGVNVVMINRVIAEQIPCPGS
jgi:hypothetical protein